MQKSNEQIKNQQFASKLLSGDISKEEEQILFSYYDSKDADLTKIEIPRKFHGNEELYRDELYKKISKRITTKKTRPLRIWLWSSAAAIFLVVGLILFNRSSNEHGKIVVANVKQINTVAERKFNDPVLVLGDGSTVKLSKNRLSALASEKGLNITQDVDGKLIYTVKNNNDKVLFNELKTPIGQQLVIFLADGTKVCLNAGSSLKFPTVFNTEERKVFLKGEAYFEVTKNKKKPFKVFTLGQEIEVLGTHFNVNAYDNELTVKTTLVEGSVKVKSKSTSCFATLVPGQQSALVRGNLAVATVDISEAIAWRLGYFKFVDQDLESIMRTLQRWYDVEVVYETKNNPNLTFDGKISQTKSVSSILKIIEEAGNVHFKVSGRRITVLK